MIAQPKPSALRVWWIPQIPGEPFRVNVGSFAEGMHLLEVLASCGGRLYRWAP